MEFPEEFIQEIGLTEEQLPKLKEKVSEFISRKEEEWGKVANTNAERIIDGAIEPVMKLTGITREKGQKAADYLKFASENYFKGQKTTIERKEQELENKIKNLGGDESILKELETTKEQLIALKEKEAKFADWEENDYKGKYEQLSNELSSVKLESYFNSQKPSIPDSVNEYEFNYKWDNFKNATKDKFNIVKEGDIVWAVDKENEFKKTKLSDLVKKDNELSSLLNGGTKGLGSKPKSVKLEGVPFDVPENVDSKVRATLIKEYLTSQGESVTSTSYAKKFAELNQKILAQKTAS